MMAQHGLQSVGATISILAISTGSVKHKYHLNVGILVQPLSNCSEILSITSRVMTANSASTRFPCFSIYHGSGDCLVQQGFLYWVSCWSCSDNCCHNDVDQKRATNTCSFPLFLVHLTKTSDFFEGFICPWIHWIVDTLFQWYCEPPAVP